MRTYLISFVLVMCAAFASGAVTTTTERNDYTGTASTATYPYTFMIYAKADLAVIERVIATGTETTLVLDTDYTVSGVGAAGGGSIVLTAGNLAATTTVTIKRAQPLTQLTVLRAQGAFRAEDVEKIVDKGTMQAQTLGDSISRSFRLPMSEAGTSAMTVLPTAALRASKYFAFDVDGKPVAVAGGSAVADVSASSILATGTSTARTAAAWMGDVLNVKAFGATGDGVTDDTTAVQAALTAVATTGSAVYFPAGTYFLTLQLTCNNKAVCIRGDGIEVSILRWDSTATTYGLSFTDTSQDYHVQVRDLSLLTEKTALGTAITNTRTGEAVMSLVQNRTSPRLSVDNVDIRGVGTNAQNGWLYGIVGTDVQHVSLNDVHFSGYDAGVDATPQSEAAFSFLGANGPTEISASGIWAFYAKSGVRVRGSVEGAQIVNATLVAVNYGIDWSTPGGHPQTAITNSHIAAYIDGVNATTMTQAFVSGNLFYERSDAAVDGTGVTLTDCRYVTVSNNTFVKLGGGGLVYKAIYLGGTTDFTNVTGNLVQSANYGVDMGSSTANNVHTGNALAGATIPLRDSSVSNIKSKGAYSTMARITTPATIPDTTATAMTWNSSVIDDIGAISIGSHATTFVIPAGVSYVSIEGCVEWDVSALGQRRMEIQKNGTTIAQVARVNNPASANFADNISAHMVPVTAADAISLKLTQTSGGDLDVIVDSSTFFRITVENKDN